MNGQLTALRARPDTAPNAFLRFAIPVISVTPAISTIPHASPFRLDQASGRQSANVHQ